MINSKFGNPDPDWDYNYLWTNLVNAHSELESLIIFITDLEDSNSENNGAIAVKLQSIREKLAEASKACDFLNKGETQ